MRASGLNLVAVVLLTTAVCPAAVTSVSGGVSSSVREFIDAAEASFASDSAQTAPGVDLPILANTQLTSTDLGGLLVGEAQSFSEFSDPLRLDQPNPEEFALEAACFSTGSGVSYLVSATATESRTAVFVRNSRDGIPREINFGFSNNAQVASHVFLSGAIVLWSTDRLVDPASIIADVRFTVARDGDSGSLFSTSVRMDGTGASQIAGPIRLEAIQPGGLADFGLDQNSVNQLSQLAETGALRMVTIPTQSHRYVYAVRADEAFELVATVEIELSNAADGTGVAAVMGRPFQNLADFIEGALPEIDGAKLQVALNRTIGEQAEPTKGRALPGTCGIIGGEGAVLVLPLLLARRVRRIGR